MPLPQGLGRFNRIATNRLVRLFAGQVPGLGVVGHEGRRTGRRYRTPVNVFRRDGGFAVALTYGRRAEWARNLLAAGGAEITTRGRVTTVVNPRIVTDEERRFVPRPIRPILAAIGVDEFLLVDEQNGA